ncbi:MAG: Ig-like domain-containing protein [Firmicutes bacterium]|nr:Ig-like domain-containing protein [Bacillota bacterium]
MKRLYKRFFPWLIILLVLTGSPLPATALSAGINNGALGAPGMNEVKSISAGYNFFIALKNDGTVWTWGSNTYGQLGNGTTADSATPVQVSGPGGVGYLTNIVVVSNSDNWSIALKDDGTVWAWGRNIFGQLGNNTFTNSSYPVQVSQLQNIVAISAGGGFNLALRSDGTVWAWGYDMNYELGIGVTSSGVNKPVQVKAPSGSGYLTNVVSIAAGSYTSYALKTDGTVWSWGANNAGGLGNAPLSTGWSPYPGQVKGPNAVGYLTGVVAISAGKDQVFALMPDGTVWGWGRNYDFELANPVYGLSLYPVRVEQYDGTTYSNLTGITAIAAGASVSVALKSDGTVVEWGRKNTTYPNPVAGLQNIVAVASGPASMALDANGKIYTWTFGSTPTQVSLGNSGPGAAVVANISVNYPTVTVQAGSTTQLTVQADMSDNSTLDVTSDSSYQSNNNNVATVSSSGLITGGSQGSATVTVNYGGQSVQVPVTVTAPPKTPTGLTVTPSSVSIPVGGTRQLQVNENFSDGSWTTVTSTASYASNASSLAGVSAAGFITGVAGGSAQVTVSYGGYTVNVPVTVTIISDDTSGENSGSPTTITSSRGTTGTPVTITTTRDTSGPPAVTTPPATTASPPTTATSTRDTASSYMVTAPPASTTSSPATTTSSRGTTSSPTTTTTASARDTNGTATVIPPPTSTSTNDPYNTLYSTRTGIGGTIQVIGAQR